MGEQGADDGGPGAPPAPAPLNPDEASEVARLELCAQSMDVVTMLAGGERMSNRTHAFEQKKQKFVDAFLASDRLAEYPLPPEDVLDENRGIDYTSGTMRTVLAREVSLARAPAPTRLDPTAVAHELLHSGHGDDFRRLKDLPLHEITPALVLAHLETFAFALEPRLAATIARRATLVLLNRRRCMPDGRNDRWQRVAIAEFDEKAEREAIMSEPALRALPGRRGVHVWGDVDDIDQSICVVCKLTRQQAEGSNCPGHSEKGTIDSAVDEGDVQ